MGLSYNSPLKVNRLNYKLDKLHRIKSFIEKFTLCVHTHLHLVISEKINRETQTTLDNR